VKAARTVCGGTLAVMHSLISEHYVGRVLPWVLGLMTLLLVWRTLISGPSRKSLFEWMWRKVFHQDTVGIMKPGVIAKENSPETTLPRRTLTREVIVFFRNVSERGDVSKTPKRLEFLIHTNTIRKLLYALPKRGFSGARRSEVTVGAKLNHNSNKELVRHCSEVPQLHHWLKAWKLLSRYGNKLQKASRKSLTFTSEGLAYAYFRTDSFNYLFTSNVGRLNLSLFKLLADPCFLFIAYSSLKNKNAGGVNYIPVGNVTLAGIGKLAERLKNHRYTPKPTKRVFIPKANGKMRPLGIASSEDKIVQKGIQLLIEPLFEYQFHDNSHGFRPRRSCHTALQQIYFRWRGIKWFIEADFVSCFDRISHPILLSVIGRRLDDYWMLRTINSLLKCGYIHFGNMCDSQLELKIGTPQGSVLSPLLCNILLHDLDCFIDGFMKQVNLESPNKVISREYTSTRRYIGTPWEPVWNMINDLAPTMSGKPIRGSLRQICKEDSASRGVKYYAEGENSRRLAYIRYADDFFARLHWYKYRSSSNIMRNL